jgi:uncharacterized oxidoreductase
MKLNNNTILLTGGTSGIGFELLKKYYSLDNQLIVVSSNKYNLLELQNQFPKIEIIICDLGDLLAVMNLIDTCLRKYPQINIIINNAGIQNQYNWLEEKEGHHKIENESRINFISPMQIIYGLLPNLIHQPHAAIINVSSALAFVPKKSAPVYCATKSALHSFTQSLRYQLENTNIKVFEIIPPLVDTAMTAGRGTKKISPAYLVNKFIANFEKNVLESNIGKTKMLRILQRISPTIAERLLKNT